MSDDKLVDPRIAEALGQVRFPGVPRDIVSLGLLVRATADADGTATIALRLPAGRTDVPDALAKDIAGALSGLGLRPRLEVAQAPSPPAGAQAAAPAEELLTETRAVLAVSSAKGGVGKSTVSTNLACAFQAAGYATGLLDADVYGPSLPIMMGVEERPKAAGGNRFHPVERYGVKCMSMGFFLDDSSPVIWRGPMVAGLVRQFLADCEWGPLDVMVVDLPPGTGDAQLTLAQQIRLNGAVVVTTPQTVALRDVERGVGMFRRLQVPLLGLVENMAFHHCPECGEEERIFGPGGGADLAASHEIPFLGALPLDPSLREHADRGAPAVFAEPDSIAGKAFIDIAAKLAGDLGIAG